MTEHHATCADCGAQSPHTYREYDVARILSAHQCDDACLHCGFHNPMHRGLCRNCYANPEIRIDYPRIDGKRTKYDTVEDVEQFVEAGIGIAEAVSRIGIQRDSIRVSLQRAGRLDLYRRLIAS